MRRHPDEDIHAQVTQVIDGDAERALQYATRLIPNVSDEAWRTLAPMIDALNRAAAERARR